MNPARVSCLLALASGLAFGVLGSSPLLAADHPATPPPADPARQQRLAWFHEAKFGLFIHWGLYAIPAGEWKGLPAPGLGEWIMNRAQIPVREYEQLAAQFHPLKFDADAWVRLAQDAGMRYLVMTAKHHDGFALFRSAVSPYNVVDATPFRRDVLKEIAAACRRHHLRLGFYYSQAQDWHEPNGAGNTWDFGPDDRKDFDQYLRTKAEPQVSELLSNYGPVCLLWFDTPRLMAAGNRAQRFADLVRALQPDCLIDGRLGVEGDYQSTGDNAIPDMPLAGAWETPATINHTWGFRKDDDDWKSPEDLIFKLADIVSKGGNYLLNVGPTADGLIPERCQEILRSVGAWLKINGAAIYGTGPTPFGEEIGHFGVNQLDSSGRSVFAARTDWRCTTQPGKLNFIVFHWPRNGFELPPFKNAIKRAYLLGDPDRHRIEMKPGDAGLTLALPRIPPNPIANVIVVEIDGDQVER